MTWYYVKEGEAAGPISDEELVSKLRIGSILPTTLVWRAGMTEWQAASQITSLIAVPSASAAKALAPAAPIPAAGAPPVLPNFFCTMCGNVIPADQLVHISGRAVCANCKPRYVQQMQEGLNAPVKVPMLDGTMAGFGTTPQSELADPATRLVAYILDLIFIGVPIMIGYFVIIALVFGAAAGVNAAGGNNATAALSIMTVMFAFMGGAFAWVFFYWTWFVGRRGATPGMKIMKLKMVRADRSPVGYGLAFGRALLLYIINAFTMGLTNITAFFDREKRTLTDMICGTRVLRVTQ